MAGANSPFDLQTADDHSAAVIVTIYSFASVSVLVAGIRFLLSAFRGIKLACDDRSYLLATLWAITSGIMWHMAVMVGLGKHVDTVSPSRLDRFYKLRYAAQMFEIASMLCAKISFSLLVVRICPEDVRAKKIALGTSTAWAVLSILVIAFQCPLPHPWRIEPTRCATRGNLLYLVIALNVVTDVGLALWIIPCVWRLRMNRLDRILVIILFGLRALILAPAMSEMIQFHSYLNDSDQTGVAVSQAILGQVTVYISLFTAAIPRVNQFISRLYTDRAALALPEFEMVESDQAPSQEEVEPKLRVIPPNDAIRTTAISSNSDTPAWFKESPLCCGSVTVFRDGGFTEPSGAE